MTQRPTQPVICPGTHLSLDLQAQEGRGARSGGLRRFVILPLITPVFAVRNHRWVGPTAVARPESSALPRGGERDASQVWSKARKDASALGRAGKGAAKREQALRTRRSDRSQGTPAAHVVVPHRLRSTRRQPVWAASVAWVSPRLLPRDAASFRTPLQGFGELHGHGRINGGRRVVREQAPHALR